MVSHGRLVAFTQQHNNYASLTRVYVKSQLLSLCEAYGINLSARSTKQVLAEALLQAIAGNEHIPFTATLDNRTFAVVGRSESDGHILMRLSRGNIVFDHAILKRRCVMNIKYAIILTQDF